MTREERELAIEELRGCIIAEEHGKDGKPNGNVTCELTKDTIDMAIKALEQAPTTKNDLGVDREDAVERLNALKQFIGYDKDSEIVKATQKSLDMAIEALEQEATTKNDLALIHTEGLDEEIRCTMCTNSMKSDRGCDGSCIVDKDMYKAVMDAIEKRIQPTTKNDLGVTSELEKNSKKLEKNFGELDCISREQALEPYKILENTDTLSVYTIRQNLAELPSVTPQPRKGLWIPLGNYDDYGIENSYKCSECSGIDTYPDDFCPDCGADMRKVEV